MGKDLPALNRYRTVRRDRRRWYRVVVFLAILVTFFTTYLLIIPALTWERGLICTLEEHTHTDACYQADGTLSCGIPAHRHTDACYDALPAEISPYICGAAEHTHTDACRDESGKLLCTLPEHTHTELCCAREKDAPASDKLLQVGYVTPDGATGTAIGNAAGFANLRNGGSFYLSADITVSSSVTVSRNTTLDLNGHKITVSCNPLINVTGGTFTLTDGKAATVSVSAASTEKPFGNTASYANGTLVYYVTETAVTDPSTGATAETVKRYTVSGGGRIIGSAGGRFINQTGGTVKLNGGYICNFRSDSGGAILVGGGTLEQNGAVLAANTSTNEGGAVYVSNNATVSVTGGVISGNTAAVNGGGIACVSANATINMSGGYITGNRANGEDYSNGGGGVMLRGAAKFNYSGGYITGNQAYSGGGFKILPDYGGGSSGSVTMTGGFITANNAIRYEGGGMNINAGGYLRLTGGYFTNNSCGTGINDSDFADWGGGGLFIAENSCTCYIENALVTNNAAGGFGGGVAGCSTGRITSSGDGGWAIFDNDALGVHTSGSSSAKSEDHTYAAANPVFMANGYSDYFCALSSAVTGGMIGGGRAMWSGSADGVPVSSNRTDDILIAASIMGLDCNASDSDKAAAKSASRVFFNGNESPTHGGGILANGFLIFGDVESVMTYARLDFGCTKKLIGKNGAGAGMTAGQFAFTLTDEYGNIAATASNTADGTVVFDRRLIFDTVGSFTYYLRELTPEDDSASVIPDTAVYQMTVTTVKESAGTVPWTDVPISRIALSRITVTDTKSGTVLYDGSPGNDDSHGIFFDPTGGRGFTNRVLPESVPTVSVLVKKSWKGGTKTPVTVTLLKDGESVGSQTLSNGNNWQYEWKDLPSDGVYTVTETPAAGFVPTYSYEYEISTEDTQGPSNECRLFELSGSYYIPASSYTVGKRYIIVSPENDHLLYVSSGHEDAGFSSADAYAAVSRSATVGGKRYDVAFLAGEVPDRSVFIPETVTKDGYQYTCLGCVGTSSWLLVQEAGGNHLKGANSHDWSSAFRLQNGHFQGQWEWARNNEWRYVTWTGSTFTTATALSNIVYTTVSAVRTVATVTNTPIASVPFSLTVRKTGDADMVLPGAEFQIEKNGNPIRFRYDSAKKLYVYTTSATGSVTKLKTGPDGMIRLSGLSQGNYILRETAPPDGYTVVGAQTIVLDETTPDANLCVTVKDGTGTPVLPATGTDGGFFSPRLLYAGGAVLLIAAACMTIGINLRERRKRDR